MWPGEPEVLVLEKCLKNKKKTRNQDIIEHCNKGNKTKGRKFEDIEEASEFWRTLWEGTRSGNAGME